MRLPPAAQVGGGAGTQRLSWDPLFGSQGYVVEVGSGPGLSNVGSTTVDSSTLTTTISGLTPGNTYFVRVRSIGFSGGNTSANAGTASDELSFVAA